MAVLGMYYRMIFISSSISLIRKNEQQVISISIQLFVCLQYFSYNDVWLCDGPDMSTLELTSFGLTNRKEIKFWSLRGSLKGEPI